MAAQALSLAAFVAVAAGVGLLRYAWRRYSARHGALVGAGWLLLALSAILAAGAFGAETGPALAIAAFCVVGLTLVFANIEFRQRRVRAASAPFADPAERRSSIAWTALRIATACILSALAALAVGIAVAACAPVQSSNVVFFTTFGILLLWTVFAVWSTTDTHALRVFSVLGAIAAAAYGLAGWPGVCG